MSVIFCFVMEPIITIAAILLIIKIIILATIVDIPIII